MNKVAQTWIFDFLAGFLMFVFLLILSISLLDSIDARSDYENVQRQVDLLSNALISPGFPHSWDVSSVVLPGLLSEDKLDYDKLDAFDALGYGRSKALLQVTGEYWFYFKNASGIMEVNGKCVRGYPFVGCDFPDVSSVSQSHTDRAWSERILLIDHQIVSMIVVVWK